MQSIVRTVSMAIFLGACGGATASTPPPAGGAAAATAAAQPLDGRTFDVMLEEPGGKPSPDTLNFAEGKFESAGCTPLGFPKWTEYTAASAPDGTGFQVTTHHPSGTSMAWKGTVQGDRIEGTAARTMNGETDTGTFKGQIRK